MAVDSRAEYWENVQIPARLDLVELLPARLPKRLRFETKADVIERSLATENRLRKAGPGLQDMVESLADCRLGNCACRQPICPICARLFRRWFAADGMAIARKINNPVTLTLFCEAVPQGQLHRVDIAKLHDRVRQRFRRAGLGDIIAMGGTEVAHRASIMIGSSTFICSSAIWRARLKRGFAPLGRRATYELPFGFRRSSIRRSKSATW
jgi:hypothetical protein